MVWTKAVALLLTTTLCQSCATAQPQPWDISVGKTADTSEFGVDAAVYVIRDDDRNCFLISVDESNVGQSCPNSYIKFPVPPGSHSLKIHKKADFGWVGVAGQSTFESGRTYYFLYDVEFTGTQFIYSLTQLTPESARERLRTYGEALASSVPLSARTDTLARMLFSDDPETVKRAGKALLAAKEKDRVLLDRTADKLLEIQSKASISEVDPGAYLCLALGQSGDGRYKTFLTHLAETGWHKKLREHAAKAAEALPEGSEPQYPGTVQ